MVNKSGSAGKQLGAGTNNNLSTFDESALSALTARIEKGLDNTTGKTNQSSNRPTTATKNGKNKEERKQKLQKQHGGLHATINGQPSKDNRGVKRDASGKAKLKAHTKKNDARQSIPNNDADDRAALLEEILALGGTADDLDLVADALSDDDDVVHESNDPLDKSLRDDLARFVGDLGLAQSLADDEGTASEDEEVHSELADNESPLEVVSDKAEGMSLSHTTSAVKQPQQGTTSKAAAQHKDDNRLVSGISNISVTILT